MNARRASSSSREPSTFNIVTVSPGSSRIIRPPPDRPEASRARLEAIHAIHAGVVVVDEDHLDCDDGSEDEWGSYDSSQDPDWWDVFAHLKHREKSQRKNALRLESLRAHLAGKKKEDDDEEEEEGETESPIDMRRQMMDRRRSILRELLETEKRFFENLKVAEDVWILGLQEMVSEGTLSQKIYDDVMGHGFCEIVNLHRGLRFWLREEEDLLEETSWDAPARSRLGQIFLPLIPFFERYEEHTRTHCEVMRTWRDLKNHHSSEVIRRATTLMEKDPRTTRLGFLSYLLLPISRLPRYRWLIGDLVKTYMHEPVEQVREELGALVQVFAHFSKASRRVSEALKLAQAREKMEELKEKYVDDFWYNSTRLILVQSGEMPGCTGSGLIGYLDNVFLIDSTTGGEEVRKRIHLVLFTDAILIGRWSDEANVLPSFGAGSRRNSPKRRNRYVATHFFVFESIPDIDFLVRRFIKDRSNKHRFRLCRSVVIDCVSEKIMFAWLKWIAGAYRQQLLLRNK